MKTAEDIFIEKHFPNMGVNEETKLWFSSLGNSDKIIESMKEYAKLVAQQALENASKNVKMQQGSLRPQNNQIDYVGTHYMMIDKSSITNPDNIPL